MYLAMPPRPQILYVPIPNSLPWTSNIMTHSSEQVLKHIHMLNSSMWLLRLCMLAHCANSADTHCSIEVHVAPCMQCIANLHCTCLRVSRQTFPDEVQRVQDKPSHNLCAGCPHTSIYIAQMQTQHIWTHVWVTTHVHVWSIFIMYQLVVPVCVYLWYIC